MMFIIYCYEGNVYIKACGYTSSFFTCVVDPEPEPEPLFIWTSGAGIT